jgi:competence protein ComEA
MIHRVKLGLALLAAGTLMGGTFFVWPRSTTPPADALLITGITPLAGLTTTAGPAARASVAPTLTVAPVTVYASGAVHTPGVYTLPGTARISDLLQAAGGPAAGADLDRINLAARLRDEDHVAFAYQGSPAAAAPPLVQGPAASAPPTAGTAGGSAAAPDPAPASINLNTADAQTLDTLPGIGPALAGRIVADRNQHGPFARLEAVQDVSGIGPTLYERIKPYLTLGP